MGIGPGATPAATFQIQDVNPIPGVDHDVGWVQITMPEACLVKSSQGLPHARQQMQADLPLLEILEEGLPLDFLRDDGHPIAEPTPFQTPQDGLGHSNTARGEALAVLQFTGQS